MRTAILTIVVALGASAGSAEAACRIAAFNFSGGLDVTTTAVTDGATCTAGFTGNVTSVDIAAPARNGKTSKAGPLRASYQPKPGFKGADSFVLRVCRQQCVNVTYNVTVQ